MNILFFFQSTINPIFGGVQRVTDTLGEYFQSTGINVSYLSAKKKGNLDLTNQFYLPNEVKVNCEENKLFYKKILVEKAIDIVVNQSAISPYDCYPIINWTKDTQSKIITVFHNSLYGMYGTRGGHLSYLTKRLKRFPIVIKCLDGLLIYLFKIKYKSIYSQVVAESDAVVLLSDKFKGEIKYFSGINDLEHLLSICNPVTINPLNSEPTKLKEVLFVGRLSEQKRVDLLLSIWHKTSKEFPDWILKIVGDGECKQSIENTINTLNLERVELLGFQNPEPHYATASIFCLTSAYEGFGLVLTEAMCYGVVPIAFASYPNITDIIEDGVSGFLVSPFDINSYASKLKNLMSNISLRDNMASCSKKKSTQFSINSIGSEWISLFNRLKQ